MIEFIVWTLFMLLGIGAWCWAITSLVIWSGKGGNK